MVANLQDFPKRNTWRLSSVQCSLLPSGHRESESFPKVLLQGFLEGAGGMRREEKAGVQVESSSY